MVFAQTFLLRKNGKCREFLGLLDPKKGADSPISLTTVVFEKRATYLFSGLER
jgi:hypothetical protein